MSKMTLGGGGVLNFTLLLGKGSQKAVLQASYGST